jgi:DNA repair exonuclease SbcCD ATPase subunit
VARAIDEAEAARRIAAQHADRAVEFRASRDDGVRALTRLLGQAAHAEIADDLVAQTLQAFTDYVDACKARAEVAQQAARRPDLIAAHTQRQQLEASHQQALSVREAQGGNVVELAATVGLIAEPLEAAADGLRRWVREQEARREAFTKRKTDVALLDQLLGGRELDDLKSDLATQIANAGDEPDVPMPPDLNVFSAEAKSRHDRTINLDGQLKGKIQTLGNDLGPVAEAAEAEADAMRAVTQVETLATCLSAATDELMNAKERANASIAPALADRMRPWLPRVTNGRYHDVTVDPGDLTMQVTEATGQVRQADRLSLGTTEQIYLLLRVTLSQVLSGGAETAPLIFDDVTTQSDAVRTVAVMEMLHELSTEHQVILFTQEDEVIEWAQQHVDPDRDKMIQLVAP